MRGWRSGQAPRPHAVELSRHLAMLREEGLVATRREGTTIYYRIGSERVRPILAELYRLFCLETKAKR